METRLRKRKAIDDLENNLVQKQMTEYFYQRSSKLRPRDIVIDDKSLVKIVNTTVPHKVKLESEVDPEIDYVSNEVKVEIKEEVDVVVPEDEFIFKEDGQSSNDSNDQVYDVKTDHETISSTVYPFKKAPTEPQFLRKAHYLETLLARKVWKRVAKKLNDLDFLNLINSTPFLRDLLYEERCNFLFKPVFEVLVPKLARNCDILMKTEAQPVLFRSRAVCKNWKSSVDTLISKWYNDFGQTIGQKSVSLKNWLDKTYKFEALTDQFDKFTVKFQLMHGLCGNNPFVGRYINIVKRIQTKGQLVETNWISGANLLEKFGHHIWSCQLNVSYKNPLEIQTQKELLEFLTKLPELKHLKIGYSDFGFYKEDADDTISKQLMPPNLKNLQTLNLVSVSPDFCHKILNENRNITSLSIQRNWCNKPCPKYFAYLKNLRNLESLQISLQSSEDLKYLCKINSPLKTLILSNVKYNIVDWSAELDTISKFSETLEALKLHNLARLPCDTNFLQYSYNARLYLPKLKIFHSEISNLFCLDFLLANKHSLEEIFIKTTSVKLNTEIKQILLSVKKKQIIQFLGFEDKLLESNIWRMLPKLKKVTIELNGLKTEYTKEAWKKTSCVTGFSKN